MYDHFVSPMVREKQKISETFALVKNSIIWLILKIAITFNPPWQILLWLCTSEHSDQLSLSLLIHPFGALLFCISTRHCNIIFSSFLHKAVGSCIYLIKLFSVKIHVSIRTCLSIIQYLHFKFLSPSKKSKWDQRFNLAYLHVPELSSSW